MRLVVKNATLYQKKALWLIFILVIFLFPLFSTHAQNIEYLGSTLWSGVNDVKIVGNYAYCAFFNGLVILDVTNPTSPAFVSQYYIGGDYANYDRRQGQRIFVSGNYVYFTADYLGLKIIDVSDPVNPVLASGYLPQTPNDACGIFVVDSLAYLTSNRFSYPSYLEILNISEPYNPSLLGSCNITSDARAVRVQGDYAYVADDLRGLQIVNVSDPANPVIVGHYQASSYAIDIAVSGNYAYLAYGYNGMVIVDVTDPANPTYAGSWSNPDFFFVGVSINGNYAYLTSNGRFYIIDITDPTHPASLAFLQGDWYFGTDILGGYAYVSALVTGIRVIDVANPANPTPAGAYDTPRQINDVFIAGNYAYVAGLSPSLSIVDISNTSNPVIVGSCIIGDIPVSIQVVGDYAYLANGFQGLRIVDIHNPQNPVPMGNYEMPSAVYDVFVVYPYAYMADQSRGVYIINVSDPAHPTLTGIYDTPYSAQGIYVSGNYAYVADTYSLQIINISDPVNPVFVGSCSSPSGGPASVFVSGGYAYGSSGNGMLIIDVSDLANPLWIREFRTGGAVWDIQVVNNYAYVAEQWNSAWGQGTQIINVNAPANPVVAGEFKTPGNGLGIAVYQNNIYLADTYSFMILHSDLTGLEDDNPTPHDFSLSQNYPNPFNPTTTISYSIPRAGRVSIMVYNITGQKVATVLDSYQQAGEHSIIWNASAYTSGLYFYRIKSGDMQLTKMMTLLK